MQDHGAVEHLEHAAHSAHAAHDAHELPNFVSFLKNHFPDAGWSNFLHQWENLLFAGIIGVILSLVFGIAAKKRAMRPEAGIANFIEAVVEGFENFVVSIMGDRGRQHVPFLGTLFVYILLMNWSGLVPFSKSPTASWNTTIALAVITVLYIHVSGIRALGLGHYLHHLAGSPKGVLPWVIGGILIFPLNIILELVAVPFSLSLRLFANISSEDSLLYSFAQLNAASNFVAIPLQVFANVLALLFSLIQAFVFTLLSTVYISLLMPHEEHHEEKHAADHLQHNHHPQPTHH